MSIRSGQSITTLFTTRRFDTGAATNADSTPTGTLYVNGTADAASVTVTNITAGVYKAAVTLPTLAVNDVVSIRISATVNSVSDNAKVWEDTKDVFAGAIPDVAYASAGGLGDVKNINGVSASSVAAIGAYIGNATAALSVDASGRVDIGKLLGTAWLTPAVAGTPDVNMKQLGGSTQSATDLKDFADTGYDPATHKVQGVVLTDTATNTATLAGAATVTVGTNNDKTGYSLASTGLDSIAVTAPSGVASTFPGMVVQLWRRLFKKTVYDSSGQTIKTYADDGTTVVTTQTATSSAGVETQGPAT